MSNISNWLNDEVYPSLFERVDTAFPEHQFIRYKRGWRSKTYLNGTPHKTRADKTVINERAPYCILEQGGEVINIYDYIQKRDKLTDLETLEKLSQLSGEPLPKADYKESSKAKRKQATILEDAQGYFSYCLKTSKNAKETIDYLTSRGYSENNIEDMELGYIPGQEKLYKYLIETKKHTKEEVKKALHLTKIIGETHILSIPYRTLSGQIRGFIVRTIDPDKTPKYIVSTGLKRDTTLFNLKSIKGDKDLVIVEGYIDALFSETKGMDNVVGLGGTSLNETQIEEAIKRGAKKFTLCLDNDKGGKEGTLRALELLNRNTELPVYVATLPEGIKDPDQLIKDKGVEVLQEAINKAVKGWEYSLKNILTTYLGKEEDSGVLSSKDIDSFLEEVTIKASNINSPVDKDLFIGEFLRIVEPYNISKESLEATVDKLTYKKSKEEQRVEFNNLLRKATDLNTKGEVNKAIELLSKQSKQLIGKDKEGEFNKLLLPVREEDIKETLKNKPDSLSSGYTIEEELLLPSGALSFFVAPTSHGKTSILINLLLNTAQSYPDKKFYLFSYEEDREAITLKALNTFINKPLSQKNRKSINSYYSKGEDKYFKDKEAFYRGKESFFTGLIDTQRVNINYVNYSSETLIEAIRYLHKNSNVGGIFIDYMQLLRKEGKYNSRQEELKQVCIDLKDIAVETGLPIILGAQFNREVNNHLLLHPTKIGEAGDIERIANLIVGFWNNSFKPILSSGEENEIASKNIQEPGTIYAKILKNRDGIANIDEVLNWNGNTGKISNGDTVNF